MFDGQEIANTVNTGRFFFAIPLCGVVPTQAPLVSFTLAYCTQNFVVESTVTLYMIEFATVKASNLSVIRQFRVVRVKVTSLIILRVVDVCLLPPKSWTVCVVVR